MPHLWCVPASRAMKSAGRIAPNLHVTVHSTFLRAHLDCAHNWRLAPMLWLRLRRPTFLCGYSVPRRSYDLFRRIRHARRRRDVESAVRQNLAALLDIGSFQAHDERHFGFYFLKRSDDRTSDDVALHDAAEDVYQ